VVLLVLRGYPGYQCPLCSRQVQDFVRNTEAFAGAGAKVVMVYPGPSAELSRRAAEFVEGKSLPAAFDLLLDPDYTFTKLYQLRWDEPKETAYPSTFLIGRDGRVRQRKISRSHGDRTTAREVLGWLAAP
jgi:peroxiredoxin